jgi:2-isopropylmalate synthase
MSPDEVIKRAVHAVEYARTFVDDVEFSLEDARRSSDFHADSDGCSKG